MLMPTDTSNPSQTLLDLRLNKFRKNKGTTSTSVSPQQTQEKKQKKKRTTFVVVLAVIVHPTDTKSNTTRGKERKEEKLLNKTKHTMCECVGEEWTQSMAVSMEFAKRRQKKVPQQTEERSLSVNEELRSTNAQLPQRYVQQIPIDLLLLGGGEEWKKGKERKRKGPLSSVTAFCTDYTDIQRKKSESIYVNNTVEPTWQQQ